MRTGTFSSSAILAALRRRAPAITSYLLSSSSRTNNGARTPWLLKLAANSPRLFSSNRLRGLLDDSIRAVTDTSRYSWFCVVAVCISHSPFDFVELCWLWLMNQNGTLSAIADSAAGGTLYETESDSELPESDSCVSSGFGVMAPRITAAVCCTASRLSRKRLASPCQSWM